MKTKKLYPTPVSPFAKHSGTLVLGKKDIDCYVLDNGDRVISLRATVKSISGDVNGDLSKYIGIKALQPYIDRNSVTNNLIEFTIPGNPNKAKGITAEKFLNICSAYVDALSNSPEELTPKQYEIAINCAILISACAKTGLIALIDEATGYQYIRAADELQVKLQAYISDELRAWEKTFPDELWEEFGRLTGWSEPLTNRPRYWGKLVNELIYYALDPDIAEYLKTNKPNPSSSGKHYHSWLTGDFGVRKLTEHINQIIGVAKTCTTMQELRDKVAHYYRKEPIQLTMNDYIDRYGI